MHRNTQVADDNRAAPNEAIIRYFEYSYEFLDRYSNTVRPHRASKLPSAGTKSSATA